MGNPFLDAFEDLVASDSRNCIDKAVIRTIRSLEDTGKRQYQEFARKCLMNAPNPFMTQLRETPWFSLKNLGAR